MGVSNGCVLSSHSVPPDLRVVVYRVAIAAGGERESGIMFMDDI